MDITTEESSSYKGQFRENYMQGKGKLRWSNGRKYKGEWELNKRQGRGTFR